MSSHVARFPRPSPAVFATFCTFYILHSNVLHSGGGNGLGTRLGKGLSIIIGMELELPKLPFMAVHVVPVVPVQ